MSKSFIRTFNKLPKKWSACPTDYINNQRISYLVAESPTYLTKSQLEAGRKVVARIVRRFKPRARYIVHPVFITPMTKKGLGSRMGKEKGIIHKYICRLHANAVLFEFHNIKKPVLMGLRRSVGLKLPIHLKYIFNK